MECLKLLRRYQSRYGQGRVFPSHRVLAGQLGVSLSSVKHWIAEFGKTGVVETTLRGPRSASYKVTMQPVEKPVENNEICTSFCTPSCTSLGVVSLYELPTVEILETNERMRSLVREYFGNGQIKGKTADEDLIAQIAGILGRPEIFAVFCHALREFGRFPESWGFMLWTARRVAHGRVETSPATTRGAKVSPMLDRPTAKPMAIAAAASGASDGQGRYYGDPGIDVRAVAAKMAMNRRF